MASYAFEECANPSLTAFRMKFLPREFPQFGLDPNLLDLVERYLVVRAVVELGRARTFVSGHRLGVFERTPHCRDRR
jgi:hypothetical protein